MVRRSFLLVILLVFLFLASGCVTVNTDGCCSQKQPASPVKKEVKIQAQPEVKKEAKAGQNIIEKTDNWVKDNLW